MTTQEIANQLADLCRNGEFEKAQKDLYAEDAVSIEPQESPAFKKEEKGGRKYDEGWLNAFK